MLSHGGPFGCCAQRKNSLDPVVASALSIILHLLLVRGDEAPYPAWNHRRHSR